MKPFTQASGASPFASSVPQPTSVPPLTGVAAFGIEEPEPQPSSIVEEKPIDLPPPPGTKKQT